MKIYTSVDDENHKAGDHNTMDDYKILFDKSYISYNNEHNKINNTVTNNLLNIPNDNTNKMPIVDEIHKFSNDIKNLNILSNSATFPSNHDSQENEIKETINDFVSSMKLLKHSPITKINNDDDDVKDFTYLSDDDFSDSSSYVCEELDNVVFDTSHLDETIDSDTEIEKDIVEYIPEACLINDGQITLRVGRVTLDEVTLKL